VALRWFLQTAVQGFQGDSGELTLERGGRGALAGRLTTRARAISGNGQLFITGSFEGVEPVPAPPGCAGTPPDTARADSAASGADTLDHGDVD
jgi:hypothetical protein